MEEKPIVHGTADNIERAGYVHTPEKIARLIHEVLLLLPDADYLVGDLTGAGTGHLLAPFAGDPHARLVAIEIAGERANDLRERIPHAQIYPNDCLAVRFTPGSFSALVTNPPYLVQDGQYLELHMLRHVIPFLMADGVLVTILPMRSAWNAHMVELLARYLYDIRAFKFPDEPGEAAFDRYTQAVIIGKRRPVSLKAADAGLVAELKGWRYDARRKKKGLSPWLGGATLPELPHEAGPHSYPVPPLRAMPTVTVLRASSAMVKLAMQAAGIQSTSRWREATTYDQRRHALQPSLMPLIGKVHLAALILATDILDGRVLTGPDGKRYIFSSFVTTRWQESPLDEEDRLKRVLRKRLLTDLPVLGVLDCESGETTYHRGPDAYAYLDPWLPILSKLVLAEYRPRYELGSAPDWMIRVALSIGTDKRLLGALHPGLSIAQLHRVFAHWVAFAELGKDAFAGEPGVGKTRMMIALMAIMAHYWAHRDDPSFPENAQKRPRPRWVKRLRVAWRASRWTKGDGPGALPVAVMVPKRAIPTWLKECAAAWPEAKTIVIRSHTDVRRWMDRCAEERCPAIIAIFSHSTTRPQLLTWRPSVLERPQGTRAIPDLEAAGEPILDAAGRLIGKKDPRSGEVITRKLPVSQFYCPECKQLITATPRSLMSGFEQLDSDDLVLDALEAAEERPVEHIAWFREQPRWCRNVRPVKERRGSKARRRSEQVCGAPLWTRCRLPEVEARYPQLPFAAWASGVEAQAVRLRIAAEAERTVPPGTARRDAGRRAEASPRSVHRIGSPEGREEEAAPASFSPYDYLSHYYRSCTAFVGIDESHTLQGQNTDRARAGHRFLQSAPTRTMASGTHYTDLVHFFYYWYRFAPEFWKALGIRWSDVARAVREFGAVMQTTRQRLVAKKGTAEVELSVSTKPAPGISARLLPLLLAYYVYIDVLDVGAHMPGRREIPVVVDMNDEELLKLRTASEAELAAARKALSDAEANYALLTMIGAEEEVMDAADLIQAEALAHLQEAEADQARLAHCDLSSAYQQVLSGLRDQALAGNSTAQMMLGILPGWFAAYPFAPAFTITRVQRGDWGEEEGRATIFTAPTLSEEYLYPLERECRRIVEQELGEIIDSATPPRARRVMLYYEQSRKRNLGQRLSWVLRDKNPWELPPSLDAEQREDAIAQAVANGHSVILVPYRKVGEALNLQMIDTVIWYEMSQNLTWLEQGNRRPWRLGKEEEVRVYYLVYQGTVAHQKLITLGQHSGAASLFAGNSPEGELVALVGADQVALAQIARKLDGLDDLSAAFARRDAEREATLKVGRAWIGVDEDPLPERVERLRAETDSEKKAAVLEAEAIIAEGERPLGLEATESAGSEPHPPGSPAHTAGEGRAAPRKRGSERRGEARAAEAPCDVLYIPPVGAQEEERPPLYASTLWGEPVAESGKRRARRRGPTASDLSA
ncbi:MAG: hypothetical protein ACRDOE_00010 [Streptosporangiaceae bacterium]